jgi:hypothetical protein
MGAQHDERKGYVETDEGDGLAKGLLLRRRERTTPHGGVGDCT